MPSVLPDGEPVPTTGELPASARSELAATPLSIYLHVPFCATRCGYCDFNTYTANELQGTGTDDYLCAAHAEIDLARGVLGDGHPAASTVFFGGGTPTMLSGGELSGLLAHVRDAFGLEADAEVTTEANPETVTPELLDELLAGGFTRISLGMQSARPHVLQVLERRHTPGRAVEAAKLAHAAGFGDVSLDLIYGTPGESLDDWRASLEAALEAEPEHVSAYALIVEDGTRLAHQIRRGQLPMTDDDDLADKYLLTEDVLTGAGFDAYEVSNWSRGPEHRARHNMAYWLGDTWWGIGPGAHSHAGGVRWWNAKHPRSYAAALAEGHSPGAGRELVSAEDRRIERVLLELRLSDGLPWEVLTDSELGRVPGFVERGLARITHERMVLTLQGRLLADAVIRDLLD
ncbi:MAG: radical SAM family heme chaperone HemW [Luteococcus sp.]|uniref:radical SAM family heme chaperone HemW n=1 Tax=Luteococcus sp. TaxID=1969402 RepID=UPI002649638F|nr:radical SAM family heme chaperone HemW [Luteococcus sp.]MDN5562320.1 radical SAM family heme chaperone HemW [Luteococcus sp.]